MFIPGFPLDSYFDLSFSYEALHLYIEKVTKQLAAQALALAQSGG